MERIRIKVGVGKVEAQEADYVVTGETDGKMFNCLTLLLLFLPSAPAFPCQF